jgi:arabinose-5-phosphate isomerase
MGDALAIALMVARGFTPEQFAGFHPGGTLGRRLFLTLGDVLKTGGSAQTASSIPLDAPLDAVILGITAGRVGAVVVTENDRIAGIITDGDLRRAFKNMAKQADAPNNLLASELMTADPQTMDASELAAKGFSQMQSRKINQLVVTDGDQLAGVVHLHALISAGIF